MLWPRCLSAQGSQQQSVWLDAAGTQNGLYGLHEGPEIAGCMTHTALQYSKSHLHQRRLVQSGGPISAWQLGRTYAAINDLVQQCAALGPVVASSRLLECQQSSMKGMVGIE